MSSEKDSDESKPGTALTNSLASDALDLAIEAGDAGIDAVVSSGVLDGVPILGLVQSAYRAVRHIPVLLFQRRVARMLAATAEATSAEKRQAFAEKASETGQAERLGETILLFLEKADEIQKPALIGRIIAAHIRDELDRDDAFRLCTMINRAYYADLKLLRSFRYGTGAPRQSIYASLAAAGFLTNAGFDGGVWNAEIPELAGGDLLALNEFGAALVRFGFEREIDLRAEIKAGEAEYEAQQKELIRRAKDLGASLARATMKSPL